MDPGGQLRGGPTKLAAPPSSGSRLSSASALQYGHDSLWRSPSDPALAGNGSPSGPAYFARPGGPADVLYGTAIYEPKFGNNGVTLFGFAESEIRFWQTSQWTMASRQAA